ncbi:hypothetical protein H0H81_010892, partial [Sphagnurus paluster]
LYHLRRSTSPRLLALCASGEPSSYACMLHTLSCRRCSTRRGKDDTDEAYTYTHAVLHGLQDGECVGGRRRLGCQACRDFYEVEVEGFVFLPPNEGGAVRIAVAPADGLPYVASLVGAEVLVQCDLMGGELVPVHVVHVPMVVAHERKAVSGVWTTLFRNYNIIVIATLHKGPVQVKMAANSWNGDGAVWSKFCSDSYSESCDVDLLISSHGQHSINIPIIPARDYLLRNEIPGLHKADVLLTQKRNLSVQMYMSCLKVKVTLNVNQDLPGRTSFPGVSHGLVSWKCTFIPDDQL